MKKKLKKTPEEWVLAREKILLSTIASFRIEGINISSKAAREIFHRVELSLKKQDGHLGPLPPTMEGE